MTDISELGIDQEIFVACTFSVKTIRILGNSFYPSKLDIRAEVIDQDYVNDDFSLDFSLAKINYFFDKIIGRGIIFTRSNEFAYEVLLPTGDNVTGNNLVITPEEPTDDHLAEIFQAKLNALANGALIFGVIEVKSDNLDGLTFTFTGHGESNLPDMEQWVGERSFFSKPWWSRNDASTLDVVPHEDSDLSKPPAFAYSLDFLADAMRPTATGGMVVRPEFRPQVIEGGKT